jgi:hypothetical protein
MDGTIIEMQKEERRLACLSMSFDKVKKLMHNTLESKGRNSEVFVINVTPSTELPAEFHTEEELIVEQRNNFRTLPNDVFRELLQPMDSSPVG